MLSIIGFVVVLIPLVVVHEFGHFFFAKLFGVRADAFSVGFGPVIFHKKIGETDFRVSAIPLGGYVKLLGEDPSTELSEADKKRAVHHQVPWKRFFIFFGGPLFNFIWAVIVFMVMMAIGEPQIANVVGRVLPDSNEAKAGLVSGDKIVEVDGTPVLKFEEIFKAVEDKPSQMVQLKVERNGAVLPLNVQTETGDGFSAYGEQKKVGSFEGIVPSARMAKIAIADPNSIAAKAGFKTGDEIIATDSNAVATYEDLEAKYKTVHATNFEVKHEDGSIQKIALAAPYTGSLAKDYGIFSSELFVQEAMKGTPAEKAGIKKGDRLAKVNGVEIRSFFELRQNIQKAGEEKGKAVISVERDGKNIDFEIVPQVSSERDPMMKKRVQFTIGVMPMLAMMEPVTVLERTYNPFTLLYKGTSRMLDMSFRNLVSIGKMFVGQVSVNSLGGPILIGKLAGDSLSRGIIDFLRMMAVLSIGLGILNILPIPVLDGGHIVMLGIEVIRGKALSLKQMEMAQKVGLVLILFIMGIVMKNDISRLPIFN